MSNQSRLRTQQAKLLAMQAFNANELTISDLKDVLALLEEPTLPQGEESPQSFRGMRH